MRLLKAILVPIAVLLSLQGAGIAGDIKPGSDWVTLSARNFFSLRAPPGTKFVFEQGTDSFASSFVNPEFAITFDYGSYSNDLSGASSDPDYKTESITIDGREGVLVTGPGDEHTGCRHGDLLTAAYVVVDHKSDTKLEITGCASSPDEIATIQTIFRTIVFNKN